MIISIMLLELLVQSYGFSSNYFFSRATFYTPCASYYQKQETITLNNE